MKGKTKAPAPVRVRVLRLPHGMGLPLPTYQTPSAAGLDLIAAIDRDHPVTIAPGSRMLVPTGIVLELPEGYEGQVRPRSGLALEQGITVLNSPGTIDADYRGEVYVLLANLGGAPFEVRRGERVAQLIVQPIVRATFTEAEALSKTDRGSGGFGSTGNSTQGTRARTQRPATKAKALPARKAKPTRKANAPAKPAARAKRQSKR